MIILATAVILSLSSSGIINKASEAKTKSDIANAKELAATAYAESMMNNKQIHTMVIFQHMQWRSLEMQDCLLQQVRI